MPKKEKTGGRFKRFAMPIAIGAVALSGAAALTTGALFTDSVTVTNNAFSTGTLVLTPGVTTAAWSISGAAPGAVEYRALTVTNSGSLGLRYALSQVSSDPDGKALNAQVNLQVKPLAAASCTAAGWGATAPLNGAGGTSLATAAVFGSAAAGAQAGDRELAAGANESLCFRLSIPTSVGNAHAGAVTSTTLTFSAEQTSNN